MIQIFKYNQKTWIIECWSVDIKNDEKKLCQNSKVFLCKVYDLNEWVNLFNFHWENNFATRVGKIDLHLLEIARRPPA